MVKKYKKLSKEDIKLLDNFSDELSVEEKRQYIYRKWFYDIEFFSDYFLFEWKHFEWRPEFIKTPFYHKEIWDYLDKWENLNIIIARWHWKTTAIKIWILYQLLYGLQKEIMYIANTWLWEETVWDLKKEIEINDLIIDVFWELSPTDLTWKDEDVRKKMKLKKWRQSQIELLNDTSIFSITKWGSVRWRRPSKVIFDDPQDDKDVEPKRKLLVEKFNNWVFTSVYWTLLPWNSICVLWTIVWNLCLVKYLRDVKKWNTVEYEACDSNFENILWRDNFDKKALQKKHKDMWIASFNQEYRNIPLSVEDRIIKEHWIKYYDNAPSDFDEIVMIIDPASETKEKNDFTWICVTWRIWDKHYVLYAKWHKLSPLEFPALVTSLNDKFKPNVIWFEKNKETTMWVLLKVNYNLPVELFHTHKDKRTRLLNIAWKIEFWNVFFKSNQEELVFQLTNFPDLEHDDVMDSFIMAIAYEVKSFATAVSF